MENMKLKTLKDLKAISDNPMFNMGAEEQRGRIKQEAIRWVKKGTKLENKNLDNGDYVRAAFHGGAVRILGMFHNITEEDLK